MAGEDMTEEDIQQRYIEMEREDWDNSQTDSGIVRELSLGGTEEGNINSSIGTLGVSTNETPIEKEIRKSVEREQSLRRSRGLPNLPSSPEYVELNLRKNVLSQSLITKSEKFQSKDRQFAGKKMQQDIHEEAQREEALVRMGKIPGFYDKGTVRQLKEKKHVFEVFQKPSDSTLALSTRRKTTCLSSSSDVDQKTPIAKDSYRRSVDLLGFTDCQTSARRDGNGAGLSEGLLSRNFTTTDGEPAQKHSYFQQEVKRPETTITNGGLNRSLSGAGGHDTITRLLRDNDHEAVEEEVPKENPFFKLRSSSNIVKVQRDISEAQEREKELWKQRISLYGGRAGVALDEDMMPSMSVSNGLVSADLADSSFGYGAEPSAGHQSAGKLIIWPPPSVREQRTSQTERPQNSRRRNPLVQRWESGQVNGHQEEKD